jgi:hypothetical protein
LIIIAVVVLGIVQAHAQVEIYITESNKSATVIEFGVTRPNEPVVDSFKVRNPTSKEVKIVAARLDQVGATSDVVFEFDTIFSNEESVRPGTTLNFKVVYRASGPFPPDSVAEIRLVLQVVDVSTGSQLDQKTLLLRGLKTNKAVGSLQRQIRFDSVYVNPSPVPFSTYRAQSTFNSRLLVQSQRVRLRTNWMGYREVYVDTAAMVEFARRGSVEWPLRYLPQDMGADTAEFTISYVNSNDAADTTLTTIISGFGVRQSLELGQVSVASGPGDVNVSGDTISISDILAGSEASVVSIPLRNNGNVDVQVDSVRIATISGPAAFTVRQPVTKISVGDTKELLVEFAPDRKATFSASVEVYTDLGRRAIRGVPTSASTHTFTLVGASKSLLEVKPDSIDYGVVLFSWRCNFVETEEFEITNRGASDIQVDSIRFSPIDVDLAFTPSSFLLPAGATRTVLCSFKPQTRGRIKGDILVHTSGSERVRPVVMAADVQEPYTVFLGMPESTRGRPGSIVELPVRVLSGTPVGAQRGSLALEYNSSVVEFVGVRRESTACENSIISDVPRARGRQIVFSDEQGLLDRDTLMILQVRLFLGDSSRSSIEFVKDSSRIGTNACEDLLPVLFRPGSVQIDSVCGLSYKTAVRGLKSFRAGVLPNPAFDVATVAVIAKPGNMATVDVLDAFGRPCTETVQVVCSDGVTTASIDVSKLPPAAYAVVVRMGDGIHTIPLVVQR